MRTSGQGLANGERVHVRGTRTRGAFDGTIQEVREAFAVVRRDAPKAFTFSVAFADLRRLRRQPAPRLPKTLAERLDAARDLDGPLVAASRI